MIPKLGSDAQRRVYLALSDEWQPAQDIAEIAGIPAKGAGPRSWRSPGAA